MFALSYKGEINDENVYDTYEEAERAREEEIRDACREDARDGCYSKRREAFYWHALQVVELLHARTDKGKVRHQEAGRDHKKMV